jgi:hypothetical protein
MAYTTIEELSEYLGITSSEHGALLNDAIQAAQAWIDNYTGRTFAPSADTIRYFDDDCYDGDTLYLDADLCSITTVTNGDAVLIANTEYTTMPRNVTPWYALKFKDTSTYAWDGFTGEIAITGKWGYSTTVPAPVKQATLILAAYLYRRKDNLLDGDRTIIASGGTILPQTMPEDAAKLLDGYRCVV